MPDLATAAIADLHAWHEQQNPLVRALTEPLTARVTDTLTAMQAVIDAEVAAREALQAEQAMALQVTQDRIDKLERMMFGQKAERTKKTPDARKEARQRRRSELSEDEKEARRKAAAAARQEKLDALRTKVVVVPLDADVAEGR